MRERTLTAVTQEKHLLFLCFDLFSCSVDSLGFFFFFYFFSFLFSPSVVVVGFIGTMRLNYVFELFFSPSVTFFIVDINLCLYVGLL